MPDKEHSWKEAHLVKKTKGPKGLEVSFYFDHEPDNIQSMMMQEEPSQRNTTLNENRLDNLTELTHLNEASVLRTIKERYLEDAIYTYSGTIRIGVYMALLTPS